MTSRTIGKVSVFEKFVAILMAIVILVSFTGIARADLEQPEIKLPTLDEVNCASYCVYDKTADEIILSKEHDAKIYPASMTKIMTAALALDYLDTNETLMASANAIGSISSDSTIMGVCVGEVTTVSEYLYGLMLPSGNDAANVLAEGVIDAIFTNYPSDSLRAGPDGINAKYFEDYFGMSALEILNGYKLTAFTVLMNYRAQAIGCVNTHFCNAHGLHDDDHYTTASDLTKIMAMACENETFCKLIHTPTHYFGRTNVHKEDGWSIVTNSNKILIDPWLIAKTSEGYDTHAICMVGGKTGTTSMAGTGMTTYSVNENGHELFISVCGIPSEYYSYQTRYVATVVAYGNKTCWDLNPVSVLPGKIGDYQSANITEAERAQYDPLYLPYSSWNTDIDEAMNVPPIDNGEEDVPLEPDTTEGESGTTTPTTVATPNPSSNSDSDKDKKEESELVTWIANNFVLTVVIGIICLLILCFIIIIVVKLVGHTRRKKRNKNKIRRPYIGEVIREMPDTKKLNKK